jgi:hypothetical protein
VVTFLRWVVDGHVLVWFRNPRLSAQPAIHNFRLFLKPTRNPEEPP